jgi:hypothetical protein
LPGMVLPPRYRFSKSAVERQWRIWDGFHPILHVDNVHRPV